LGITVCRAQYHRTNIDNFDDERGSLMMKEVLWLTEMGTDEGRSIIQAHWDRG